VVGFQVSPLENFMTRGISFTFTVVEALVTFLAGFLPTMA